MMSAFIASAVAVPVVWYASTAKVQRVHSKKEAAIMNALGQVRRHPAVGLAAAAVYQLCGAAVIVVLQQRQPKHPVVGLAAAAAAAVYEYCGAVVSAEAVQLGRNAQLGQVLGTGGAPKRCLHWRLLL
jgi:hypothetical protein